VRLDHALGRLEPEPVVSNAFDEFLDQIERPTDTESGE
jgi:hypothetical protein